VPERWTKATFYGTFSSSVCCSCTTFWPVQKALQGEALQLFLRVEGLTALGRHGLGSSKDGKRSKAIPVVIVILAKLFKVASRNHER
jgi:hypothetical protein